MTKGNKNKVWGTRVKAPTSKLLQSINSSIDVDKRLFNEDIDASIAHCEMLSKQKIIKSESAKKIISTHSSSFWKSKSAAHSCSLSGSEWKSESLRYHSLIDWLNCI